MKPPLVLPVRAARKGASWMDRNPSRSQRGDGADVVGASRGALSADGAHLR